MCSSTKPKAISGSNEQLPSAAPSVAAGDNHDYGGEEIDDVDD